MQIAPLWTYSHTESINEGQMLETMKKATKRQEKMLNAYSLEGTWSQAEQQAIINPMLEEIPINMSLLTINYDLGCSIDQWNPQLFLCPLQSAVQIPFSPNSPSLMEATQMLDYSEYESYFAY